MHHEDMMPSFIHRLKVNDAGQCLAHSLKHAAGGWLGEVKKLHIYIAYIYAFSFPYPKPQKSMFLGFAGVTPRSIHSTTLAISYDTYTRMKDAGEVA